jgi:AraC-like DNA-binding protein
MSLVEAFERVVRYFSIQHSGASIQIDVTDRSFIIVHRLFGGAANVSSAVVAAGRLWAVANLALLPERAFGVRLRPASAELGCAAPADAGNIIADIFGTEVKFGSAGWRLVFDRPAVLAVSRPVVSSALPYLDAYADMELRDAPAIDDVVRMVSAEVRGRLVGAPPTVAEIANALGLSTRTLQRRLTTAGRSYGSVLDEVRRTRAAELLADSRRDLAEVAYKLGYSDRSAFTLAAMRWFGLPPSRMR